jgi:DNA-binding response OmpR family regulator
MTRAELARGSEAQSLEEGNAVDVQIHSLRKKLGPNSIGTLRGVGYFLEEATQ